MAGIVTRKFSSTNFSPAETVKDRPKLRFRVLLFSYYRDAYIVEELTPHIQ